MIRLSKQIIEKPLKRLASGVFFSKKEATVSIDPGSQRRNSSSTLARWILPALMWGLAHAAGAEIYVVDNWTDAAGVLGDEVKITVLIEALGGE